MMTEEEARRELRAWVAARCRRVRPDELRDDTPILETRILTSLQVMDLLLLVEQLSGRAIDVDQLRPGAFRDIETMVRRFGLADPVEAR